MLKSFFAPDKGLSREESNIAYLSNASDALVQACDIISEIYSNFTEAMRLLDENGIEHRLKIPCDFAEPCMDVFCSFQQMQILIGNEIDSIQYRLQSKK